MPAPLYKQAKTTTTTKQTQRHNTKAQNKYKQEQHQTTTLNNKQHKTKHGKQQYV